MIGLIPKKAVGIAVVMSFLLLGFSGCSSHRKTTTTTTDTASESVSITTVPAAESTTTATTTTTTETEAEPHGLIGGFFHFLGDVIAFPFRLLGGMFDAIF